MHDDINRLLADFGKPFGLESLALDENGYCCLRFGEVYVNVEADGESSLVLLYSSLGRMPEDAGREAYTRLLEANYFFQQTAGGTVGLEAGTGVVAMTRMVDIAAMQVLDWEAVINAFVDAAERCAQLFDALRDSAQAVVPAPGFTPMTFA